MSIGIFKVSSLNARFNGLNLSSECTTRIPDKLLAILICINILQIPSEIYTIQNISNRCVVNYILDEINRICDIIDGQTTISPTMEMDINDFGLTGSALDMYNTLTTVINSESYQYTNFDTLLKCTKYYAYTCTSCLTLVRVSTFTNITKYVIPTVDSVFLSMTLNNLLYIVGNVNLEIEQSRLRQTQDAYSIITFLKNNACDKIILCGAFGDIDYDIKQLLFNGDCKEPQIPSLLPCDITDNVYTSMIHNLKCNIDDVSYTELFQYQRLLGASVINKQCKKKYRDYFADYFEDYFCKPKKTKCNKDKVCEPKCDYEKKVNYRDPITLLKTCLSLYNTLNDITDTNERYTGFYNTFNKELTCKYPKGLLNGILYGLLYCGNYKLPCEKRIINNNSELLASDHILVSECIKPNILNVELSTLNITYFNTDNYSIINDAKQEFNILNNCCTPQTNYVLQYGGFSINSFFINRTLSTLIAYNTNELEPDFGIDALWSILNPIDGEVSISVFERFGLDKHPYFYTYFWEPLYNPLTDIKMSEIIMTYQKNEFITESVFKSHLKKVLKDCKFYSRYVADIAFMISLYSTVPPLTVYNDIINQVYNYFNVCFGVLDEPCGVSYNNVDLLALIETLSQYFSANSIFMDMLKWRSLNVLYLAVLNGLESDTNYSFIFDISPYGGDLYDALQASDFSSAYNIMDDIINELNDSSNAVRDLLDMIYNYIVNNCNV